MNINLPYILTVIFVILISMTFHEAMHAFTSYWLGDETAKLQGRLSLNPIKHIDPFLTILLPLILALSGGPIFGGAKPVPYNPNNVRGGEWGAALVAIAGPLTNFVIAFVSFAILALVSPLNIAWVNQILAIATVVNLGFFIFNMLPIPPLDGSRVIYALAPEFIRKFMVAVEPFGIIIIFGLILIMGQAFSVFFESSVNFFIAAFSRLFGV